MSLAEIKRRIQPGTTWDVTNVTVRPDSAVFGTHRRTVVRTRTRDFSLTVPGLEHRYPEGSRVAWPKASQASIGDDQVIRFYNGPPVPANLFLTLVPAGTATVPAYAGNPDGSVTAKTIDTNTAREFCNSRRDIPSLTATLACGHTITYERDGIFAPAFRTGHQAPCPQCGCPRAVHDISS